MHSTHTCISNPCINVQLDQFFVEDSTNALTLDSLNESHPIIQPVSNPNEISSLFDSISYDKVLP